MRYPFPPYDLRPPQLVGRKSVAHSAEDVALPAITRRPPYRPTRALNLRPSTSAAIRNTTASATDTSDSSRPPSSDDPYRRRDERQRAKNAKHNSEEDAGGGNAAGTTSPGATETKPPKPAGKRPGMPGF